MAVTRSSYGGNSSTRSCSGAESSAGEPSAWPLFSSWPILLYMASFFLAMRPFHASRGLELPDNLVS
jgi:hypothetical protein